ncbi:hypothetical protein Tdes44962_MAKER05493 [Teratosphaeria destructans]|uniref:Uncharacterized protein n=1 Tax=Teratosphaeria destructans TaxID=418781 RepID=A0A9W7SJX1_9PEZI|nr:hypothetical protein Tdes44962_MAKER05493 [Teratosphaeria destructans]
MDIATQPGPLARMPSAVASMRDRHALPPSIMTRLNSAVINADDARVNPTDREPRVGADAALNLMRRACDRSSIDSTSSDWRGEALHLEIGDYESDVAIHMTGPRDTRRDGRIFQDTEIGAIGDLDTVVPQEGKRRWVQRASSTVMAAVQSAGKRIRQMSLFERKDSRRVSGDDGDKKASPSTGEGSSPYVVERVVDGEENRTTIEVQEVVPSGATTPRPVMSSAHRIASEVAEPTDRLDRSESEGPISGGEVRGGDMVHSAEAAPAAALSRVDRQGSDDDAVDIEDEDLERDGGALQRYHSEAIIDGRCKAQYDLQRMEENEEPITLLRRQQRIEKHLLDAQQQGKFDEDLDARFNQDTGSERDQQIACEILGREKQLCDHVYQEAFIKSELHEIFGAPHKLTRRTYFKRSKLKTARDTQIAMMYYQLLRKAEISAWRRSKGKPCNPQDEIKEEDLPDAPDTEAGRKAVEALRARRRMTVGPDGRPCLGCENIDKVNLPSLEKRATKG